jgi:hypothetical protein
MKLIANNLVSELIRLIPILIDCIPPDQSTRIQNAIRITRNIIKQLNELRDIE